MTSPQPRYRGLWLPLVTPFRDGELDEPSLRRLAVHLAPHVDGFVLAATTGEALALSRAETRRVVEAAAEALDAASVRRPILIGVCGASTRGVADALRDMEPWPRDGFLVSCPYYVRPAQEGLRLHFEAIADSTAADVLIYNIPYRTGVNLRNETMLRLAERPNIAGVKDCCADPAQSGELIRLKPADFAVLTGEDAVFDQALRQGADGGVLASAHLDPQAFRQVHGLASGGRWGEAETGWSRLAPLVELLFAEPSPAALKHCLWRMGLIASPELRLPMTPASAALAARLDQALAVGP